MKVDQFPPSVQAFVRPLIEARHAVWLIGSRASGTQTEGSDWDFVIFGSEPLVQSLAATAAPANIDALVVYDGDEFRSPWPRESDGWVKSGSLSHWAWSEVSQCEAKYMSSKEGDDWNTIRWAKGLRVLS